MLPLNSPIYAKFFSIELPIVNLSWLILLTRASLSARIRLDEALRSRAARVATTFSAYNFSLIYSSCFWYFYFSPA